MILVTGATGLVGYHLINHLLSTTEFQIKCLIRRKEDADQFIQSDRLIFEVGDVMDVLLLEKIVYGCKYLFHCAGVVSYSPFKKDLIESVNVRGTENVVNVCLNSNVRLCHVSSIASLGKPIKTSIITESTVWSKSDDNSFYSETKYFGELEVIRGIEEGLSAVIVNPSVILGRGDWNKSSTRLFKYVFDENKLYTDKKTDFVDVRDLVEIMVELTFSEIKSEKYIISGGSYSYKQIFDKIGGALHKKSPSIKASNLFTQIAWRIEHFRAVITGCDPLITKDTSKIASKSYSYSTDKISAVLNYKFHSIDETIEWVCSDLKKRYKF